MCSTLAPALPRVAIDLAKAGRSVTGVDQSRAMLALAAVKIARLAPDVAARVRLVQAPMEDFVTGGAAPPSAHLSAKSGPHLSQKF